MEKVRQRIVIFDYGSQYTHLIARRIREQRVYSEVVPFSTTAESLRADLPAGIVLSGGPNSVFAEGAPSIDPAVFDLGVPVLDTDGCVRHWNDDVLYGDCAALEICRVRLIPYFAFANRGSADMIIWTLKL